MDKKIFNEICSSCGITANYLTCLRKYGQPPTKFAFNISTFHKATCDVCGHKDVYCTEARDFFYPDFELITKNIK